MKNNGPTQDLSVEDFRALAENLPNLCWMANAEGWIYWYNQAWYDYTGTVAADMEGWGWRSVHDPEILPSVMERWTASIATGASFEMTFPLRGADGVFRPFLTRISPVRDDSGAVMRWFGNNVDISEQLRVATALRQSEEALRRLNEQLESRVALEVAAREAAQARLAQSQRMEALGQLAGGIAHDFNNILQAVSGAAMLVEQRARADDKIRRFARTITAAAARGVSITQRLLAFARRGELRVEALPTAELLDGVREVLAHTLGSAITVRADLPPGLPPLLSDRGQLETALVNLGTNARDAMPTGGTLTFSAEAVVVAEGAAEGTADGAQPAPGEYVRIFVTDTGIGMDAATLARAAEPFFTTKPVGRGTGLGLAMVKGFAEQSGGVLSIKSAPGGGTTVSLWLRQANENDAVPALADEDEDTRPPGSSVRVLVVDDDELVRETLAAQLDSLGFDVMAACGGAEALALIETGPVPDALVSDLAMPGMNGIETIRRARLLRPGLPSFLLTGYAGEQAALASGDTFTLVRKPISTRALAARIEAGLEAARR